MELPVATNSAVEEVGDSISEDTPTERFIEWTLERFAGQRMVMTTSFGMEGCALVDMYHKFGRPLTVIYLDTMFFFAETYKLRDQLMERYPNFQFVNGGTTLTPEQQAREYGDELWKYNPTQCCKIRKVDPMHPVMADVDVWITGLRRGQSSTRANIQMIEWDWKYHVLKVSPIAKWGREQIWEYIQANNVPYNELHEQGYPTVGCTHCTTPVPGSKPWDYSRDGRWAGKGKTECGLHGGAGI